jgi:hypothetical protein
MYSRFHTEGTLARSLTRSGKDRNDNPEALLHENYSKNGKTRPDFINDLRGGTAADRGAPLHETGHA